MASNDPSEKMVEVQIDESEWYPVYTIQNEPDSCSPKIMASEKTLKRWKRIFRAFNLVQNEMKERQSSAMIREGKNR
jgi:hypothetical protein